MAHGSYNYRSPLSVAYNVTVVFGGGRGDSGGGGGGGCGFLAGDGTGGF